MKKILILLLISISLSSIGQKTRVNPTLPGTTGKSGKFLRVNGTNAEWTDLTKSSVGLNNVPNVDATNPANISQSSVYRFATDTEKAARNANKVVAIMADLRLLTGNIGDKVTLLGYYAKGDGGGGEFAWDNLSTDTDNGGTAIQPNSVSTGRWVRVNKSSINAKQFGVFTNQTVQVQAAIDYTASVGAVLQLDNTSYTFGTLTLKNNLNISGNNCTINNTATTTIFYSNQAVSNVKIRDINFNGSYSSNNACIQTDGAEFVNVEISGCSFTGSRRGIDSDIVTNFTVNNCYFHDTQDNGIYFGYDKNLTRSSNITLTNVRIDSCGSNQANGITLAYVDGAILNNIKINRSGSNNGVPSQFHGIYFRSTTNIIAENVEVNKQTRGAGIHVFTSTGEVRSNSYFFKNLTITNTRNYNGIRISESDNVTIESTNVGDSYQNGIYADNGTGLIIRNTTIKNSNKSASSGAISHSAIRLGAFSQVKIQGCEFTQDRTIATHFQGNGVYMSGVCNNVLLEDNKFICMPASGGWYFLTTENSSALTSLILDKNKQTGASGFINQNTATINDIEVMDNSIKNVTGSTFIPNALLRTAYVSNNYYKTGIYAINARNGKLEQHANAAPTTDTWSVGDVVYSNSPAAGGNLGWVCVVAGTPGTWKAFGTIAN